MVNDICQFITYSLEYEMFPRENYSSTKILLINAKTINTLKQLFNKYNIRLKVVTFTFKQMHI